MRVGRIPQVLIVLVVLLGAATPMIAPVLAQENNSTSAGGNDTGSGVVNDVNSSDPAGANTSGTNNTSSNSSLGGPYGNASSSGQTASGSSSSGSQGEEAYGSGYLYDVTNNASAGPNGSVQYANNSSANGSAANGSEMNGSGLNSDADGVKGTAINAALDVVARILKFISNSIGAALTFILKKVIGAMTWTPHPPRGNTYQAATSMGDSTFWGQQYKTYSEIWQPFTLVLCGVLTGVYVLGSREVLDILPAQVQENGWLHLGIAWIMTTDTSWVIVSVILDAAGLVTQALLQTVEIKAGFVGATSLVIVALILFYLVGFWMVVAMMLIYGMRVVLLIALTPAIPALFAARAIPVRMLSEMADNLLRFWLYLAVLPIPVVMVLAVGFGMNLQPVLSSGGLTAIGASFFGLIVNTGTILAAIILPYILYQRSGASSFAMGVVNSAPTDRLRDSLKDQEDQVERSRSESQRSLRIPDSIQNIAVKANKVGILGGQGFTGGNTGGGRGGGGGGSSGRDEIYVKSETRRKKLEE